MKIYILKYLVKVFLILILIAGFLFSIYKLTACNYHKEEKSVQSITTAVVKQQAIDSLISAAVKDTVNQLNTQMKKREEQLNAQINRVLALKENYSQTVSNYNADSVHTSICDSVVTISQRLIIAQQQQVDTLLKQNKDSKQKSSVLTNLIVEKEKTIDNAYLNISALEKQVKRTWWERNQKYISFGLGILVGIGTATFITK